MPASTASILDSREPIREELLSADRLEEHAERVARQRTLLEGGIGRPLSPRVRDSGRLLLQCYRTLAGVIREEGPIMPAAESKLRCRVTLKFGFSARAP